MCKLTRCPTGIPTLDVLTKGGFPYGATVLLHGDVGAGQNEFVYTTICKSLIAKEDPKKYQFLLNGVCADIKKYAEPFGYEIRPQRFPERTYYLSISKSERNILREIKTSFCDKFYEYFRTKVIFKDFAKNYFHNSMVPESWVTGDKIIGWEETKTEGVEEIVFRCPVCEHDVTNEGHICAYCGAIFEPEEKRGIGIALAKRVKMHPVESKLEKLEHRIKKIKDKKSVQLLDQIISFIDDENIAASIVVIDSLTDLLYMGSAEFNDIILTLKGLQHVAEKRGVIIYLLHTTGTIDESKQKLITECVDAEIVFEWIKHDTTQKHRYMYIQKFRGLMSHLERDKVIFKFTAFVTPTEGYNVVGLYRI